MRLRDEYFVQNDERLTDEQLAIDLGNDVERLRARLMKSLVDQLPSVQKLFVRGAYDFKNKRLLSRCKTFSLQWRVRPEPNQPTHQRNRQTPTGVCLLIKHDQ